MRRVIAIGIVLASVGCRRHHATSAYESDTVATPPPAAAPAPSGEPAAEPAVAAPATGPRESLPDGGTINGDPKGPRPVEFNKVVTGALPSLQACFDHADVPAGKYDVTVHYIVEYPGYTGGVTAKADNVPKPVLDCCVGVIEALKFPQYGGSKVERDLPFTYRKTVVSATPPRDGGATAEQK